MTAQPIGPMRTMTLTLNSILPTYKHCPFDNITLPMFGKHDQMASEMCHVVLLHDPDTGRVRYLKNNYGPIIPSNPANIITDMHDGDIWLLTQHDPAGEPTSNVREFLVDAVIDDTAIVVDQSGNVYSWKRGEGDSHPLCAICNQPISSVSAAHMGHRERCPMYGKDLDDEIEPDCDCEVYYHPECCPECNDDGGSGCCEFDAVAGMALEPDDSHTKLPLFVEHEWRHATYGPEIGDDHGLDILRG